MNNQTLTIRIRKNRLYCRTSPTREREANVIPERLFESVSRLKQRTKDTTTRAKRAGIPQDEMLRVKRRAWMYYTHRIGTILSGFLFPSSEIVNDVSAMYYESLNTGGKLRVVLDIEDPLLSEVPFEATYMEAAGAAIGLLENVDFVRLLQAPDRTNNMRATTSLASWYVSATDEPSETGKAAARVLQQLFQHGTIDVDVYGAGQFLNDPIPSRTPPPHLASLVAHGEGGAIDLNPWIVKRVFKPSNGALLFVCEGAKLSGRDLRKILQSSPRTVVAFSGSFQTPLAPLLFAVYNAYLLSHRNYDYASTRIRRTLARRGIPDWLQLQCWTETREHGYLVSGLAPQPLPQRFEQRILKSLGILDRKGLVYYDRETLDLSERVTETITESISLLFAEK